MEAKIEKAFEFVKDKLFSEKTCLIYDHVIKGREAHLPTVKEISAVFPNPCGYGTGMEDGMINGATMLDACLLIYERTRDALSAEFAHKLVKGQLNCAFSAKSEGFLPRGVAIEDEKTHYPDSSRDQYTMFCFGMHRYLRSELCTDFEREQIAKAAVAIARRAEKNVTPENGYDMLTDDGGKTLVNVMWGESLGNHEYLRLPMIYLLAYEATGDRYWLEKYKAIRVHAVEKSLPMTKYWALYTLQQMQASILLCYDVDMDEKWRKRYLSLMNTVADYTEALVPEVRRKLEAYGNYNDEQRSFRDIKMTPGERFIRLGHKDALSVERTDTVANFTLQDCAQVAIVSGRVQGRKPSEAASRLFYDAFSRIDLGKHERSLPLYFIDGYYRSYF